MANFRKTMDKVVKNSPTVDGIPVKSKKNEPVETKVKEAPKVIEVPKVVEEVVETQKVVDVPVEEKVVPATVVIPVNVSTAKTSFLPPKITKISDKCTKLIQHYEGFYDTAYLCPAGVPTIGYGHTRTVTKADVGVKVISMQTALDLLRADLEDAENDVCKMVSVKLNQDQFDALVSFMFNVGGTNFRTSTLRRILNDGDYAGVPEQMNRWTHGGGKVLAGLVKRRKSEGVLFSKGVFDF